MSVAEQARAGVRGSLAVTAASPLYRGATVAMFLAGLGQAAAAPQIASFLVEDLHASLTVAGLFYLTNLTAPVVGFLIGARSDRTGRRLGLFRMCAVAGAAGWVVIVAASTVWVPYLASALLLGVGGAAGAQLFAAVHDDLQRQPAAQRDGVVAVVRTALTAGWVIGPVLGSLLAATVGLRGLLLVTAAATLAQLLPLGLQREQRGQRVEVGSEQALAGVPHRLAPLLPLLAFTGLYVLVYAGEPIKYAYLPIYMRDQLHLPAAVIGAVIGIQPLVEVLLIPVSVAVAARVGIARLLAVGAGFGVAANCCFALTGQVAGLFTGQVLMGGVWGVFAALGIIAAQRLLPGRAATASAVFLSSTALASAIGGTIGGVGAGLVGLPLVFLAPALLAAAAAIGLLAMRRTLQPPVTAARPPTCS